MPANRQQRRTAEAKRKYSGHSQKTNNSGAMTNMSQQDFRAATNGGESRGSNQVPKVARNGQHYSGRHRSQYSCEVCSDEHGRPLHKHSCEVCFDEHGRPLHIHQQGQSARSISGTTGYQEDPKEERNQSRLEVDEYQRRLEKAEEKISKLQAEGLASVDRYQPHTDEDILKKLGQVEQTIRPFIFSTLAKQKSSLSDQKWEESLHSAMLQKTPEVGTLDIKGNSELKRKVLRSIVWRFLCKQLFKRPFKCFQGVTAESASSAYEMLFANPEDNEDSAKWRTMTIKRLEELGATQIIDEVRASLTEQFQSEVLDKLGYMFEKELDKNRLHKLLTVAIELAQLLAKQRAIFVFRVPKLGHGEVKLVESRDMTNKDDEYSAVEEEMEGKVWFVIQPMLVKFGTGKGERLHEHTTVRPAYVELEKGW